MRLLKARDIDRALKKKGFVEEYGKRHVKYHLQIDGKLTGISTGMSYGSGEPRQTLLHQIKNEMGFDDSDDFENYVDCTMSYEQYVAYLKRNGKV